MSISKRTQSRYLTINAEQVSCLASLFLSSYLEIVFLAVLRECRWLAVAVHTFMYAAVRDGDMKQVIVARADLGMGEGKLAAQVAHASLQAYEEADARDQREWKGSGQKKVVLQASGESELFELAERARLEGVPHAIVRDAGHTELEPGTVTTLAVGPAPDDHVDTVTGHLSLY